MHEHGFAGSRVTLEEQRTICHAVGHAEGGALRERQRLVQWPDGRGADGRVLRVLEVTVETC